MTWRELVQRLRSAAFFGLLPADRPLPAAPSGVTRRQFLKVAGIAAATVALLPETLALDEPLVLEEFAAGISLADLDALLKRIYLPYITEMLNAESPILRLLNDDRPRDGRPFVVPVKVGSHYYTSGASYYDTEHKR